MDAFTFENTRELGRKSLVRSFRSKPKKPKKRRGKRSNWIEIRKLLENDLVFHSGRMNYRERLAADLAIGSGQVEGVCKNLIGTRLKQTEAKWKQENVSRMAKLYAIFYGEPWNHYWKTAV